MEDDFDAAAEYAFEKQAEEAWLIYCERVDPEAQADLDLHDELSEATP